MAGRSEYKTVRSADRASTVHNAHIFPPVTEDTSTRTTLSSLPTFRQHYERTVLPETIAPGSEISTVAPPPPLPLEEAAAQAPPSEPKKPETVAATASTNPSEKREPSLKSIAVLPLPVTKEPSKAETQQPTVAPSTVIPSIQSVPEESVISTKVSTVQESDFSYLRKTSVRILIPPPPADKCRKKEPSMSFIVGPPPVQFRAQILNQPQVQSSSNNNNNKCQAPPRVQTSKSNKSSSSEVEAATCKARSLTEGNTERKCHPLLREKPPPDAQPLQYVTADLNNLYYDDPEPPAAPSRAEGSKPRIRLTFKETEATLPYESAPAPTDNYRDYHAAKPPPSHTHPIQYETHHVDEAEEEAIIIADKPHEEEEEEEEVVETILTPVIKSHIHRISTVYGVPEEYLKSVVASAHKGKSIKSKRSAVNVPERPPSNEQWANNKSKGTVTGVLMDTVNSDAGRQKALLKAPPGKPHHHHQRKETQGKEGPPPLPPRVKKGTKPAGKTGGIQQGRNHTLDNNNKKQVPRATLPKEEEKRIGAGAHLQAQEPEHPAAYSYRMLSMVAGGYPVQSLMAKKKVLETSQSEMSVESKPPPPPPVIPTRLPEESHAQGTSRPEQYQRESLTKTLGISNTRPNVMEPALPQPAGSKKPPPPPPPARRPTPPVVVQPHLRRVRDSMPEPPPKKLPDPDDDDFQATAAVPGRGCKAPRRSFNKKVTTAFFHGDSHPLNTRVGQKPNYQYKPSEMPASPPHEDYNDDGGVVGAAFPGKKESYPTQEWEEPPNKRRTEQAPTPQERKRKHEEEMQVVPLARAEVIKVGMKSAFQFGGEGHSRPGSLIFPEKTEIDSSAPKAKESWTAHRDTTKARQTALAVGNLLMASPRYTNHYDPNIQNTGKSPRASSARRPSLDDPVHIGQGSLFWMRENPCCSEEEEEVKWLPLEVISSRHMKNVVVSDLGEVHKPFPHFKSPGVVDEIHVDGFIAQSTLFHLLGQLYELKTLELHVSTLQGLHLDQLHAERIDLPNLKSLEISSFSLKEPDTLRYDLSRLMGNVIQVLGLKFPALTFLGIAVPFVPDMERPLMVAIWNCVLRHAETLRLLNVQCPFCELQGGGHHHHHHQPQHRRRVSLDPQVAGMDLQGAERLRLLSFHLFFWSKTGSTDFWRRFLKTQENLEYVQFWCEGPNYYKFPYDIVKKSYYTLQTLSLNVDILSYPDQSSKVPIDCNIFHGMPHLKTLALKGLLLGSRLPSSERLRPDLINVQDLGSRLETVKIMNLSMDRHDLSRLLVENNPNLKLLYLDNVGTGGNLGVTLDTLVTLLERPGGSIQKIEIFDSVNRKSLEFYEHTSVQPEQLGKGFRLIAKILLKKETKPSLRAYRTPNNDFEIIYEDDETEAGDQVRDDWVDQELKSKASVHGPGTKRIVSTLMKQQQRPGKLDSRKSLPVGLKTSVANKGSLKKFFSKNNNTTSNNNEASSSMQKKGSKSSAKQKKS